MCLFFIITVNQARRSLVWSRNAGDLSRVNIYAKRIASRSMTDCSSLGPDGAGTGAGRDIDFPESMPLTQPRVRAKLIESDITEAMSYFGRIS